MVNEQTLYRRRLAIVGVAAGISAGPAYALFRGVGAPSIVSLLVVLALAGAAVATLPRRVPEAFPKAFGPGKFWFVGWLLLSVIATALTVRLAVFMTDPTRIDLSVLPASPFMAHHSCLTAYFEAARMATSEPNIYDPQLYSVTMEGRIIDGFRIDVFEYPPPFLLLPKAAQVVSKSFLTQRTVWFAVEFAILMAGILAFAQTLKSDRAARFVLLTPALFVTMPARLTFQMGNFQLAAIGLSLLGIAAFVKGRSALGGGLLAFAILSKLFPGLLLVYLLARRRYRDVAWTAGMALGMLVLTFLVFGSRVFEAFVFYHLPRLSNGDSFLALRVPAAAAINHSIYGFAIKAMHLGVAGAGFALAGAIAWVYTVVILGVAVWMGRRAPEEWSATALLAVLGIGALRSPFLPQEYAPMIPMLLLFVLAAPGGFTRGKVVGFVIAFIVVTAGVPLNLIQPDNLGRMVALATIPQLAGYAVIIAGIRDARRAAATATASSSA